MARSILTDAERLAWERFPDEPDPDVVGAFFTLADGEVDVLRRLPVPAGRLATAVAVAAIRWLGFVPAELHHAPAAGVERLAGQLDADAEELASYVPAERTAREHRQRAARIARFRDADERDSARVEELLVVSALEHDSPLALLRTAALELRERQLLRPALSTLERLVAAARGARGARDARAPGPGAGHRDRAGAGRAVCDRRAARRQPAGVAGPRGAVGESGADRLPTGEARVPARARRKRLGA